MIAMKIYLIIFELIAFSFQTGGFQQVRVEVIMNIDKVGLGPLLNRMLGRTGPRFDKWGHPVRGVGPFHTCL